MLCYLTLYYTTILVHYLPRARPKQFTEWLSAGRWSVDDKGVQRPATLQLQARAARDLLMIAGRVLTIEGHLHVIHGDLLMIKGDILPVKGHLLIAEGRCSSRQPPRVGRSARARWPQRARVPPWLSTSKPKHKQANDTRTIIRNMRNCQAPFDPKGLRIKGEY